MIDDGKVVIRGLRLMIVHCWLVVHDCWRKLDGWCLRTWFGRGWKHLIFVQTFKSKAKHSQHAPDLGFFFPPADSSQKTKGLVSSACASMGCGSSQPVRPAAGQVPVHATCVAATKADAKHVAVVLPGNYFKLIQHNENYHYHILETWLWSWLMRKTSRLALPKSNEERLDPLLHDLGASSPTPNCSGFDLEVEPRAVEMAISLFFFQGTARV